MIWWFDDDDDDDEKKSEYYETLVYWLDASLADPGDTHLITFNII